VVFHGLFLVKNSIHINKIFFIQFNQLQC
jgi:hypothetical protein